ncbi:unnamed protein product, partial [Symbiodinium pilosum]
VAGAEGEDWDIENGNEFDLLDDVIYEGLLSRVKAGDFDAGMLGPPCGTFSNARREEDFGPRPLRQSDPVGVYGRKDLTVEEAKSVKDAVSMFDLPELQQLAGLDGVTFVEIAQCAYGAPTSKPTTLLNYKAAFYWCLALESASTLERQGVVDTRRSMAAAYPAEMNRYLALKLLAGTEGSDGIVNDIGDMKLT